MAIFGVLVLVFGWIAGDVGEKHYKLPIILAGANMLVIGLTVFGGVSFIYPPFSCSVCRKSLKDKSENSARSAVQNWGMRQLVNDQDPDFVSGPWSFLCH